MGEQENLSQEEIIQRLTARVESLEKKLEEKESKANKKEDKKKDNKKDDKKKKSTSKKVIDESGRLFSSMLDASAEAMKESADALSSLSDETDTDKLGRVPAAFVSIFRKTIDIQKKALDKFEDSYDKYDDDEDDD